MTVGTDGKPITERELRAHLKPARKGEKRREIDFTASKQKVLDLHEEKIIGPTRHKMLINELDKLENGLGR